MSDKEKYAISRRTFVKITGATVAGYALLKSIPGVEAAADVTNEASDPSLPLTTPHWVSTVCAQCSAGCGIRAKVIQGRVIKIEGNTLFPTTQGGGCPKGQAAVQVLYNPDRIKTPLRRTGERGEGKWEAITWPQALEIVTQRLKTIREQGQAHTVACMATRQNGHLDSLIHRFMESYGSPNEIFLDEIGSDSGKKVYNLTQGTEDNLAFDVANANYLIFFGASFLETHQPVVEMTRLFGHLRQGRPGIRTKIVHVDIRLSNSGAKSDERVFVKPGTDGALALGLANVIIQEGLYNADFVSRECFGFEDWKDDAGKTHMGFKSLVLKDYSPEVVSRITGVLVNVIVRLAREFAHYQPALALSGGGAGRHTNGIYNQWAVHCLNALVGNFNQPGGIRGRSIPPFASWPEVKKDEAALNSLSQPRLDKAGTSLFPLAHSIEKSFTRTLEEGTPYGLNALLLYNANPAYSQPDPNAFIAALSKVPFIVSFSSFLDDTTLYADVVLPNSTFLENWDDVVINSVPGYPIVGLRQPVIEPLYDTANTGDVIITLAHMLGGTMKDAFPWNSYRGSIRDALKGIAGHGSGSPASSNFDDFWQNLLVQGGWWDESAFSRLKFNTPSKKFEFYSQILQQKLTALAKKEASISGISPEEALNNIFLNLKIKAGGDTRYLPHHEEPRLSGDEKEYPFYLNSYGTMMLDPITGANTPWLLESFGSHVTNNWDSWVEINPETAHSLGIENGAQVWIESPKGKIRVKVKIFNGALHDVVNIPVGFGHKGWGRWAGRGANPYAIIVSDMDYLGGTSAVGNTRVKVIRA